MIGRVIVLFFMPHLLHNGEGRSSTSSTSGKTSSIRVFATYYQHVTESFQKYINKYQYLCYICCYHSFELNCRILFPKKDESSSINMDLFIYLGFYVAFNIVQIISHDG